MIIKLNVTSIIVLDKDEALDCGVTDFTQEPADRFYGTDMGIRDPFGNAIRILQPKKVAPGAKA